MRQCSSKRKIVEWWMSVVLGLQLGLCLGAATAAAHPKDQVSGTRTQGVVEKKHDIEMVVDRGYAKLVVRRTIFNASKAFEQTIFFIHPPEGAVATGLRTKGEHRWFKGVLMEADLAATKYQELTGLGTHFPKDPALLAWRDMGELILQVFPCEPGKNKTVEYTLIMPTRYEEGTHVAMLPALGTGELAATFRVRPARRGDTITVNGEEVHQTRVISLIHEHNVALHPKRAKRISGALASVGIAAKKGLNHWRFELAPQISKAPKRASIVVLIDQSASMGQERITAAFNATRACLANFEDAKVEILSFDRAARPLLGSFESPEKALDALRALAPTSKNGSSVDLALAKADELLRKVPLPRRVILLTDSLARSALPLTSLQRALNSSRALLHIGDVYAGSPRLDRNDHHPWAEVARAHGGLAWSAGATDAPEEQESVSVYEEWVRPLRIDNVSLRAPGFDSEELNVPYELPEGSGLSEFHLSEFVTPWIELSGELWSSPVKHRLRPSTAEGKRWAALAFGRSEHRDLSSDEMMVLARRGDAVSPVTSYLAIEPGVRPSTEGLDWSGEGSGQGFGSGHGRLRGSHAPRTRGGNELAYLLHHIGRAWARCGGKSKGAEVELETTRAEIVDVVRVDLEQENSERETCLRERVWRLELDERFTSERLRFVLGV